MIKQMIRSERGNVTIFTVSLFMLFIFICFYYFDVYAIYLNKQISQDSADAAALAAALKIQQIYEDGVRADIPDWIRDEQKDVDTEVQKRIAARTKYDDQGNVISKPTYEDVFNEVVKDWRIPQEIVDRFSEPDKPVDAVIAMRYFLGTSKKKDATDGEITQYLCDKVKDKWQDALFTATNISSKNHTETEVDFIFPFNKKGTVYVRVKKKMQFSTFTIPHDEEEKFKIATEATALVIWPQGVEYIDKKCDCQCKQIHSE